MGGVADVGAPTGGVVADGVVGSIGGDVSIVSLDELYRILYSFTKVIYEWEIRDNIDQGYFPYFSAPNIMQFESLICDVEDCDYIPWGVRSSRMGEVSS